MSWWGPFCFVWALVLNNFLLLPCCFPLSVKIIWGASSLTTFDRPSCILRSNYQTGGTSLLVYCRRLKIGRSSHFFGIADSCHIGHPYTALFLKLMSCSPKGTLLVLSFVESWPCKPSLTSFGHPWKDTGDPDIDKYFQAAIFSSWNLLRLPWAVTFASSTRCLLVAPIALSLGGSNSFLNSLNCSTFAPDSDATTTILFFWNKCSQLPVCLEWWESINIFTNHIHHEILGDHFDWCAGDIHHPLMQSINSITIWYRSPTSLSKLWCLVGC